MKRGIFFGLLIIILFYVISCKSKPATPATPVIPTVSFTGYSQIIVQNDFSRETDYRVELTLRWNEQSYPTGGRIPMNTDVTFTVPNGNWSGRVHWNISGILGDGSTRNLTIGELNNTRITIRLSDRQIVQRENIEVVIGERIIFGRIASNDPQVFAQNQRRRIAVGREIAQELGKALAGNVRANAGIALFPLTVRGRGFSVDDGEFLYDTINMELINTGYNIIEKRQIEALLAEHDFQMSGMVGARTIGQLLGADVVIFTIARPTSIEMMAVDVNRFRVISQVKKEI